LGQAESEHVAAEAAKLIEPDFETDQEQQQHGADLGERQDSRSWHVSRRLDHNACHEKGDDRANPEPAEGKQTQIYQPRSPVTAVRNAVTWKCNSYL
jgi:hypothetical protein